MQLRLDNLDEIPSEIYILKCSNDPFNEQKSAQKR